MTTVAENVFPQQIHSILAAHPASPPAGQVLQYRLDDGKWYEKDSSGTVTEIGADAPTNLADKDRLWTPNTGDNYLAAVSDEFDDGAIDAAWINVDAAGHDSHRTFKEAGGRLSMYHDGSADSPNYSHHGLVRPIGALSDPFSLQQGVVIQGDEQTNYAMIGFAITDGTTHGAGNQLFAWAFIGLGSDGLAFSIRNYTNWQTQGTTANGSEYHDYGAGAQHLRLRVDSGFNNAFLDYSPDGILWRQTCTLAIAGAWTPTHIGLSFLNFNVASPYYFGSWEYFRAYDQTFTPPN